MKKLFLILVATGVSCYGYAQNNIHESGSSVGIGTTSPVEGLSVANSLPNVLGIYRDLDVNAVGSAGVFFNLGARNGTEFTPGAQITGVLDNPASSGWMLFSTRNSGTLSEKMRITREGNVGIGKSNPVHTLDVIGQINVSGQSGGYTTGDIPKLSFGGADTEFTELSLPFGGPLEYKTFHGHVFKTYGGTNLAIERMRIDIAGNMGIGTADTKGYKLAVNGKIRAHEIKVETANWPDYVFAKDYSLPTLQETEKHIKEKGHLPGIPSAEEVKNNGIDLGEMNAKLLQKIEELTLHLIEMKKESVEDKTNIKELKALTDKLHLEINQIKSKL